MGLSYKDSGVDVAEGQRFVQEIKGIAQKTFNENVKTGIGGFAALYKFPQEFKNPVLVSSTDGVGTKLKLAQDLQKHDSIGQDLVAMCVNDIITVGAKPLFFLDYLVTGKLTVEVHKEIVTGIASACKKVGIPLIGGETAEHPDEMPKNKYDLAGFVVGVVDESNLLPKDDIAPGDLLFGIPSSGLHSNGFSLVRKIIQVQNLDLETFYPEIEDELGLALLKPTHLYTDIIPELHKRNLIKAAAHITGGGFYENIPRILPKNTMAYINTSEYAMPRIFPYLQAQGGVECKEMFSTFNMGIGMVVVASPDMEKEIRQFAENSILLGRIEESGKERPSVYIEGIDEK